MPTVAIDYTPAYEQGGGIGRYVRELIAALAQTDLDPEVNFRLFVTGARRRDLPPVPNERFVWRTARLSPRWFARIWHRARVPIPVEAFTGPLALYHATDFVLPPTYPRTRTLLTVHDLSFVRVPETASPRLKAYLDAVVPRSVRRADHVLADSQATKDDLIALYDTPPDKITVLLSGVDARFRRIEDAAARQAVRQTYQIPERPYIFSVGTVQPRKNYARLIQALARLRGEGHDLGLVIAGGRGWLEDPIYAVIRAEGVDDYVRFIGFADDADLPALYSAALCTAVPSLYEGFGLPLLESMACGTPVVTSDRSSLPEVAGDAGLIVDPTDLDALTGALRRLVTEAALRDDLVRRGYARAATFTWERSAHQLAAIYTKLLINKS
ncbi:MAG: glycosyltransferase family 4 protein [Chloroflexi bacterium]|nr:glycosyltransferase family 4 protein [Chloroflexota bacterium]